MSENKLESVNNSGGDSASEDSRLLEEDESELEGIAEESEDLEFEEPPRCLNYDEAARCLCMLGKNDSGLKYSYLMMNASDKNLTDISVIPTFRNVVFVDVSGNRLTESSLKVLLSMTYLLMLKADRNCIKSPEMQPGMLYLQVLCLNRNRISRTSGISHRLLECLELNYNRINSVDLNPYLLENLKVLELRGNLLQTTNGIFFPSLVSLYLADNKIERIEGFDTLVNLKILHARNNVISTLDGLTSNCVRLSYVNLRNNKISSFSEIRKLKVLQSLENLIITENPLLAELQDDHDKIDQLRIKLISVIPNLKRINKDPIIDEERDEARKFSSQGIIDDDVDDHTFAGETENDQ